MKTRNLILTAFLLLTPPAFAIPGITVANGGQTAMCQDTNGKIQSFEAFDLYEGRVVTQYKYPNSARDPLELALKLAGRLDDSQGIIARKRNDRDSVSDKVRYVAEHMTLQAPGERLQPTGDSKEYQILPEGCGLIPTINFVSPLKIDVDHDAWMGLDNVNKAALYLHEAIYWHLRLGGEEHDSRRTRKAVAYLMAGKKLQPVDVFPSEIPKRAQFCHGNGTQFLAYRNSKGNLALQFIEIGGFYMLTRTSMEEAVDFDLEDYPIDPMLSKTVRVTGQVKSLLDREAVLQLSWGRGQVILSGELQHRTQIYEKLRCTEIAP